jgi:hypothetical protein
MPLHQNSLPECLKNYVSNDMNGTDDDVQWKEDYEENSFSSDEYADSD